MTTDDADANIELYAGAIYDSTATDGYKEIYFRPNGVANSYVRLDNLSDDKYVELSAISLRAVNGNSGNMVNMDGDEFVGDTP